MTDKERYDLLMKQIRTLKDNARAWRRAFLATAALLEEYRNGRISEESRGKRDAEALEDAE